MKKLCGAAFVLLLFFVLRVFAGGVSLAWDPSTDSTVVGYRVYMGTTSLTYTNVVDVGTSTNAVISNLVAGVTYYFAATDYTAAGLESDFSAEAFYTVPTNGVLVTNIPGPPVPGPTSRVK